jgi:hypothetical protein
MSFLFSLVPPVSKSQTQQNLQNNCASVANKITAQELRIMVLPVLTVKQNKFSHFIDQTKALIDSSQ